MNTLISVLPKYQKHLLGLAFFLSLCAVSISIDQGRIKLNLQNYPLVMILMVMTAILLILVYIKIDRKEIIKLSNHIKKNSEYKDEEFESLLSKLTTRQREVYELIKSGKTNKEIMALLFIEQSTLKTHINQIYKTLKIKTRQDLKSKVNQ